MRSVAAIAELYPLAVHPPSSFPKRPFRVVWLAFLGLSACFAISLPFQEEVPPQKWPFAFGYFALLPACAVGIARLGRRALLLLIALALVPGILGVVGFALVLRSSSFDSGGIWLRVSLYLFYAVGVAAVFLSARGWLLYWRESHKPG
jgi:hypothetical protein